MPRPNIILIVADQLRGDCLGIEGRHPVLTPRLDGLAAAGARFTHAYSTAPVCIPARRSLLSGQAPRSHGLLGFRDGVEWDEERTLPALLRAAGYHTQLVGREMHQHPARKRFGYDEMTIGEDYQRWLAERLGTDAEHDPADPYGGPLYSTGIMQNDWTVAPWPYPDDTHFTAWTITQARRFLQRRDPSQPYFLTISLLAPHPPLVPPAFYLDRYLRMELPEPVVGDWADEPDTPHAPDAARARLDGELGRAARAAYYGLINHIDDQLGRVLTMLNGLRGAGAQSGNTVVAVTADHGEMLGDHHLWRKSLPYEGAARIPLLIRAPERYGIRPGTVLDSPVSLEDVMPTLLDFAGVEAPAGIDGVSLRPLLTTAAPLERDPIHLELANGDGSSFQALTDGRTKYVWFTETGREQLFDLRADPGETIDLAEHEGQADRLAEWRQMLIAALTDRPEGFVDGGALVPGRPYHPVPTHLAPPPQITDSKGTSA